MAWAEFRLRIRASAIRQTLQIEAAALPQSGGTTFAINRLAELEHLASGN